MARKGRFFFLWYVLLAGFVIVTIFPIYWMLVTSLKSFQEIYNVVPKLWPRASCGGTTWKSSRNTITVRPSSTASGSRASSPGSSVGLAIFSALRGRAGSALRGKKSMPQIFLLSYLIPQTILFIPIYIFLSNLDSRTRPGGFSSSTRPWTIPYATWVLITYFQNMPVELEEAAFVDGASRLETVIKILIPPSLPSIVSTFIFSFTICWSEYIYALVVISRKGERTIPLALSNMLVADIIPWVPSWPGRSSRPFPHDRLFVASKYIVTGLTMGSVKG